MNADFLEFKPIFSKRSTKFNRNKITGALFVYYRGHRLGKFSAKRRSKKYASAIKILLGKAIQ